MRLTSGASDGTRNYMIDGIRYVCSQFKERASGTHSERKAQAYLAGELEQWADDVQVENFSVHPHAFMGWIPVAGGIAILSVVFYWLSYFGLVHSAILAAVSFLLTVFAVTCLIVEFLLYREFIDPLFPKKTSRNVMAVRKPSGDVQRRIIFGGHTDAANEWTYALHGGLKSLAIVMVGSVFGLLLLTVFDGVWLFCAVFGNGFESAFWLVIGIVQLFLIPFFIAVLFFVNWRVVVDGANDNLSADFIAMGVLRELAEQDVRFAHTEVCALLTGSEEAGLRGALAYAKRHKAELEQVETVFIAMDTMREIEQLQIYTGGCTGTQKNSNAVGELIYEAGANCGVEMRESELYPGAIDAEAFSRYGLEAAGFCGVNHDPRTYYHTRLDTPDNISDACIHLSLDICLEAVGLYDQAGGLDAFREEGKKRFKRGHN